MSQGQRKRSESREIGMSLRPPDKVRKLQRTLHAKAKESPDYRFFTLYGTVYREDILLDAYLTCNANGGAAGVDLADGPGILAGTDRGLITELSRV